MSRALVTGAAGFVGRHLVKHLTEHGREVHGTLYGGESDAGVGCALYSCDVSNAEQVNDIFRKVQPDEVYHLAAITFVPEASAAPQKVMAINLTGTLNVLEAALQTESPCRVLAVCSAEAYAVDHAAEGPIDETCHLAPRNIYGVSKLAADLMAEQYARHKGSHVIRVRPFNHTGPGQDSRFVCSDFARQVAEMEAGKRDPVLRVGNLEAIRDFSDVRDVVRAYRMILEEAAPGAVYNICSGTGRRISDMLDNLLSLSHVSIERVQDSDRLRPSDVPRLVGDGTRVAKEIGWKPELDFHTTLADLLDYWRNETRRD